jgi:hypothetical protein
MAWTNQPLILFYGYADAALQPVNPGGIGTAGAPHNIQLPLCRPLTDFGRGFYDDLRTSGEAVGEHPGSARRLIESCCANCSRDPFPSRSG